MSLAIGQGPNAQTPLRMAQFFSALAGDGTARRPAPPPGRRARRAGDGPAGEAARRSPAVREGLARGHGAGRHRLPVLARAAGSCTGRPAPRRTARTPKQAARLVHRLRRPAGRRRRRSPWRSSSSSASAASSAAAPLAAKVADFYLNKKHGVRTDPQRQTLAERLGVRTERSAVQASGTDRTEGSAPARCPSPVAVAPRDRCCGVRRPAVLLRPVPRQPLVDGMYQYGTSSHHSMPRNFTFWKRVVDAEELRVEVERSVDGVVDELLLEGAPDAWRARAVSVTTRAESMSAVHARVGVAGEVGAAGGDGAGVEDHLGVGAHHARPPAPAPEGALEVAVAQAVDPGGALVGRGAPGRRRSGAACSAAATRTSCRVWSVEM